MANHTTDDGQPVLPTVSALRRFRKVQAELWGREGLQPGTTLTTNGLGCCRVQKWRPASTNSA